MEPLKNGALLQDRYRVEAVVSAGEGEALYRVRDLRFATDWLMREMDAGGLLEPEREAALQAFDAEAAALAELRHPGLAQVVDHFVLGGRAYVVSEWVDGASLAERVGSGGALPLEEVADFGAKILDALYFLHTGAEPRALGALSPEGIWISSEGETKLVDLGLGRHFEPRAAAAPADLRDDVRAAGAILCFMATGGEEPGAGLPQALRQVVEKALASGYPDAGELKHDLMAVAEGFAPDASPSAGAVPSTEVGVVAVAAPSARKGCGAAAVFVLLAGAFAMAGGFLARG